MDTESVLLVPARVCVFIFCLHRLRSSADKGSREQQRHQQQRCTQKQSVGGSTVRRIGHSFLSGAAVGGGFMRRSLRGTGSGLRGACQVAAVPSRRWNFRTAS
ncbi:uncharacterized protein Tco025E_09459, partial [Trypanosoma conorhini]